MITISLNNFVSIKPIGIVIFYNYTYVKPYKNTLHYGNI